jgi:hypothetical protein
MKGFSQTYSMKMKLWNKFFEHLDLAIHMYACNLLNYITDIFPFDDIITTSIEEKIRRGLLT